MRTKVTGKLEMKGMDPHHFPTNMLTISLKYSSTLTQNLTFMQLLSVLSLHWKTKFLQLFSCIPGT